METVTIRELRQSWPAVEKRLAAAGEITVTRDGEAIATLTFTPPRPPVVKKFDPTAHRKMIKKFWGSRKPPLTSEQLIAEGRAERIFSPRK